MKQNKDSIITVLILFYSFFSKSCNLDFDQFLIKPRKGLPSQLQHLHKKAFQFSIFFGIYFVIGHYLI